MPNRNLPLLFGIFLFFGTVCSAFALFAQDNPSRKLTPLPEKQRNLLEKHERLEMILLRMAESDMSSNPRRAALLKKVLGVSKDRLITMRMDEIGAILERKRLAQAIEGQEGVEKDLAELLALLESENRDQRREAEKEKIKEHLRELDDLILQQRALKGKTAETEKIEPLSETQNSLEKKAADLARRLAELQEVGPDSEKSSSKKESPDQQGKQGQNQSPSEQDDSKSEDEKSEQKLSPTQKAMQQARRRMQRAKEELEKSQKRGAVDEQEEAIAELQQARAALERILRQLREEEMIQTLQFLDARVRKMLQLEKAIRTQTERLSTEQAADSADQEAAARRVQVLASRLGADQTKVIEDADAALLLLREDGTAAAMSESLLQSRFDMLEVANRLGRAEIGRATVSLEDSIIESLQEMLEALEQAKKELQKRQQDEQAGDASQSEGEDSLIGILSELRMIRTMQKRVNERTARYAELLGEGKSDLSELKAGVEELTRQQDRIQKILRDIRLKRNQ